MVARRLMFYQIFYLHFFNDSSDLLEIMFDGRAFHYLVVNWKKIFPNVLNECPILRQWLLCLHEHQVLCKIC